MQLYLLDAITADSSLILVIGLGLVILFIAMVVAVLKLPQIAKHTKIQMKLTALMAKKLGVNKEHIQDIINAIDPAVTSEDERAFEKKLNE